MGKEKIEPEGTWVFLAWFGTPAVLLVGHVLDALPEAVAVALLLCWAGYQESKPPHS